MVGGAALRGGVCAAPRGQDEVLEMHLAPFLDYLSVFEKTIFSGRFLLMEAFYWSLIISVYFRSNIIECLDTLSLKDSLSKA